MKTHKQIFFMYACSLCGLEKDRWGNEYSQKRKFVTTADDPNKVVCTHCGYTIGLTDKQIKDAQLNVGEEIGNEKL